MTEFFENFLFAFFFSERWGIHWSHTVSLLACFHDVWVKQEGIDGDDAQTHTSHTARNCRNVCYREHHLFSFKKKKKKQHFLIEKPQLFLWNPIHTHIHTQKHSPHSLYTNIPCTHIYHMYIHVNIFCMCCTYQGLYLCHLSSI